MPTNTQIKRASAGIAQVEFIVLFCSICLASVVTWIFFGEVMVQIIGEP
jgi:hypothetical protein